MSVRRVTSLVCIALLGVPTLAMAQMPSVTVTTSAACVAPAGNLRVTANLDAEDVALARVLFRAENDTCCTRPEYFVNMRRGAGNSWWAILPAPEPGVNQVSYRVWVKESDGDERVSERRLVAVEGTCAVPTFTEAERTYAQNLIVGLTDDTQAMDPCGFECTGVVRAITAEGTMVVNQACGAVAGRLPAGAGGTIAGVGVAGAAAAGATIAGVGLGTAALLGAAALAGAAVVLGDGEDAQPISPARP
ncbi:MAG: hypothetical protein ACRD2J_17115 [Thermoanaerobaculia bacterium]